MISRSGDGAELENFFGFSPPPLLTANHRMVNGNIKLIFSQGFSLLRLNDLHRRGSLVFSKRRIIHASILILGIVNI